MSFSVEWGLGAEGKGGTEVGRKVTPGLYRVSLFGWRMGGEKGAGCAGCGQSMEGLGVRPRNVSDK